MIYLLDIAGGILYIVYRVVVFPLMVVLYSLYILLLSYRYSKMGIQISQRWAARNAKEATHQVYRYGFAFKKFITSSNPLFR